MVTDGDYTHCGKRQVMYGIVQPLCWTPGPDMMLCVNYTSIKY